MKRYRVIDEEAVELLNGPFAGIIYQYGGVKFEPDSAADQLTLSFSYEVIGGDQPSDTVAFHNYIGDILVELIEKSSKDQTTVFRSDPKGTMDASRD